MEKMLCIPAITIMSVLGNYSTISLRCPPEMRDSSRNATV